MTETQQPLELAQRAIEAYRTGDVEGFLALMNPEVEVFSHPELPNAGNFHGHEGFIRWTAQWLEAWEEFNIEPLGYEAIGERHVLIELRQYAKGRGSGVEIDMTAWYMVEFRDGLGVRMHLYATRAQALEAAEAGEAG